MSDHLARFDYFEPPMMSRFAGYEPSSAISPVVGIVGWCPELATFPDKIMQPYKLDGFELRRRSGIWKVRRGRLMFAFNKVLRHLIADSLVHIFLQILMFLVCCQ